MKAYTLRLDDELLIKLKYISLAEKRSIRDILLDLIEKKVSEVESLYPQIKQKDEINQVANILNKISDFDVYRIIREDRER